jgi:hypothetical protein
LAFLFTAMPWRALYHITDFSKQQKKLSFQRNN